MLRAVIEEPGGPVADPDLALPAGAAALATAAPDPALLPRCVMMTVDAVGGVWRYAIDAAAALNARGVAVVLAGLGPEPGALRRAEVAALPACDLVWLDGPLDWMVADEVGLDALGDRLMRLARTTGADLLHLNAPSQAAGLDPDRPLVVASHSCVVTWWAAVRGGALPADWAWQHRRNRDGLRAADAVVAPSRAHADAILAAYGPVEGLEVVPNAVRPGPTGTRDGPRPVVFAAARWWDEGKNGAVLDAAARGLPWPVELAGALAGPNGARIAIRHAVPLGERPAQEVRTRMAEAAVVACPSLYEPFGLSALEAANAGAALVVADRPIFRELWTGAALFADPSDPAAWREAFGRLMTDDALRLSLAAAAKERSAAHTPDRQADRLAAVYATAIHRHRGRRKGQDS